MAFTGEYVKVKELGRADNQVAEVGHYIDGDKTYDDKIYFIEHFSKRDGSTGSKVVGKMSIKLFNEIKNKEV